MLIALLEELAKRYEISKVHYHKLLEQRKAKVTSVEVKVKLSEIHQKINAINAALNKYQQDSNIIVTELKENEEGRGNRFIKIAERLADIMKRLPVSQLDNMTLQTVSPDDERLLSELLRLKSMTTARLQAQVPAVFQLQPLYR